MGYKITIIDGVPTMSFDRDDTIGTDLALSCLVPEGSFFLNPSFGLPAMPAKRTDQNIALVPGLFKKSVKWLLDSKKAQSIDVIAEPDSDQGRINVELKAKQANNQLIEFETFIPVV